MKIIPVKRRRSCLYTQLGIAMLVLTTMAGCVESSTAGQDRHDNAAVLAGRQLQQTLIADPEETGLHGAILDVPVPAPVFTLTGTDGTEVSFASVLETHSVTFLYFGYTTCPDICPAHMAAVGTAIEMVEPDVAEQVAVVFVSVDPERDASTLDQYLANFGDDFIGLTGTAEEVNQVMGGIGLIPSAIAEDGAYPPAHPTNIIVFTGEESRLAYPFGVSAEGIANDLTRLVSDEGILSTLE